MGTSRRPTFVETTNSSRGRPASARPRRRSDRPRPYSGAVSKYRTPASHAASTVATAWSSSTARNRLPSGAPPSPRAVTSTPVRPSRRRSPGPITARPSPPPQFRGPYWPPNGTTKHPRATERDHQRGGATSRQGHLGGGLDG